jgi:hypothetical protein
MDGRDGRRVRGTGPNTARIHVEAAVDWLLGET